MADRSTAFVSLAATLLIPLAATAAEPPPPAWLGDLMGRLAAITERHETFREERHFAALDAPVITQGRLIYRRPAHLEKITAAPDPETLVVDGDHLTITSGHDAPQSVRLGRRPEVTALVEAVRGTLSGDLGVLESHYRIRAEGGLSNWHLLLQPKDAALQHVLRDIAIAGQGTGIRDIRITQANGDDQAMSIVATP
jgi:hypothetical protein